MSMDDSLVFGMGKEKDQAKANLYQLDDPWELPKYFPFGRNKNGKSLRTHSGCWKEKEAELTAIRSAGESSSSSSASPSYVGVRKTLEFYLKDGTRGGEGTKTRWIMHEYHHLRKDDDGEALILQEDVVVRKVFERCKNNQASSDSLYRQIESCVKAYNEPKGVCFLDNQPVRLFNQPLISSHATSHNKSAQGKISTYFQHKRNYGNKTEIILRTEEQPRDLVRALRLSVERARSFLSMIDAALSNDTLECKDKRRVVDEPANRFNICDLHNPQNIISNVGSGGIGRTTLLQSRLELELQNEDSLGVLNEDLGADCAPDGKPDSVWKHFTKIRSDNNDPDGVYAACHHCDKMLRADSKKHGTRHLRRHIETCSSCTKPNPSTDEDREMLHRLRTVLDDPDEQQKMDCQEDLTQLDPWDPKLTPWYVARSSLNPNRQTQGGQWKEIKKEFTAIRKDQLQMQGCWKDVDKEITVIQMDHQMQKQVPQYMGLRRTLQFHPQDGRKVDWIMLEYQQFDDIKSPVLLLQVHMVIRKVFRYDKEGVASAFSELDRWLNGDDDHEEYLNGEGVNTDTTMPSDYYMDTPCFVFPLGEDMKTDTTTSSSDYMDTPVDRKRKRTGAASGRKSEVWLHFTKIKNTDRGLVYVVCHSCDRGYTSGSSKNGTTHLRRHSESCASKRPRTENANDATTEREAEIWPVATVPTLQ